jgi:phage terminase large subunit
MKLTTPQQTISNDPARFRVVAAGRRFGKTFLAINELAKFARYPKCRVLAIANTYRQIKGTIWDELKEQLAPLNWIKKVNESDLHIELINGSKIFLRSADNKEALRGAKYNFIVLDECADMHPDTWFSVLRPTLSDTGGHALFIGSPKGRNWFYDLWIQGNATDDWSSYQYTTIEGGNVPPEEIEAAKRDLDQRRFEQEY